MRLLCPHCKQVDTTPEARTYKSKIGIKADAKVYRAVGCRECRQTGYHGRRAIFEWMDSSSEIRTLILKNSSTDAIRDSARRAGMRTLAEDGRRLVEEGITTIEEVLSVTTVHEMEPSETKPAHPTAASNAAETALPRSLI